MSKLQDVSNICHTEHTLAAESNTQMTATNPSYERGFTLIELITTLLLIAILAVTVLPRLLSGSSYSAHSLRHEFIGELRKVQQKALNNTDLCYRIQVTSGGYQESVASRNADGSCDAAYDLGAQQAFEGGASLVLISAGVSNFSIDFDTRGRSLGGCNGSCISAIADETVTIGISAEGYVYAI
jgi:MSHA pilin protein MshC